MNVCPKCASPVVSPESTRFCAVCNYAFLGSPTLLQQPQTIAWENFDGGIVSALVKTLRNCLMSPKIFFDALAHASNTYRALLYALIVGSIGSIFSFVWTYALINPLLTYFPGLESLSIDKTMSVASLIFTPVIIIAKVGFSALYFQVLLFMTRSAKQNTSATLRVVCYAQSTAIFDIIPVFGSIISPLWSLYLLAVGFHKIHKISIFKACMIILLPIIVCIFVLVFIVVILGAGYLFQDALKDSLSLFR